MFCQDCGAANPDVAKFCVKCGKQIAVPATASPPPAPDPPPPVLLPPSEPRSHFKTGWGCFLLLGAAVLLLADIGAGGIGWFWRIVMVVMIIAAARIFYSRR